MGNTPGQLQHELEAARRTIAELQAELESRETTYRLTAQELEAGSRKIEQAHQEWMAALDVVDAPIFLHDKEFRILRCNRAYQQCAGLPFKQIIGQPYYEVFPKTGVPLAGCLRVMEKTAAAADEEEMVVGGITYRSRTFSVYGERGDYLHSVHIFEDITERKRVEAALRENEERFRAYVEQAADALFVHDFSGRFQDVNQRACLSLGYGREELLRMTVLDVETDFDLAGAQAAWSRILTGQHFMLQGHHRRKDGTTFPVEVQFGCFDLKGVRHYMGMVRDITERKQAEAAIEHANRALATLSAVNRSLVRATREDELLQAICGAIVEQKGYRMAWVGYKQDDESKSIKIMARAGHDAGYLDAAQISWAEGENGLGPSGIAFRSGATQLCQDMAHDPHCLPRRDKALERGYAASIALPLLDGDKAVFGVLNVYAQETNAFTPNEVGLLEEMAGDLAFGVRALRIRHERDHALEQSRQHLSQLHDSLEDTVQAIASMVELRDPYTAGHQAKVAGLAAAIAGQMGLPEEQVHAIHLAGIVHDLGKIKVPAEILSKPGKITDIEHSLIKIHPRAGYDILKGISFPWPVALMVLQHHERLDGSGYPQGLKGDAILIESRILCVADVVEAMSSHRPYRPSMGIEAALAEITGNRGKLYDPQAVDACQALFREQGYSL